MSPSSSLQWEDREWYQWPCGWIQENTCPRWFDFCAAIFLLVACFCAILIFIAISMGFPLLPFASGLWWSSLAFLVLGHVRDQDHGLNHFSHEHPTFPSYACLVFLSFFLALDWARVSYALRLFLVQGDVGVPIDALGIALCWSSSLRTCLLLGLSFAHKVLSKFLIFLSRFMWKYTHHGLS